MLVDEISRDVTFRRQTGAGIERVITETKKFDHHVTVAADGSMVGLRIGARDGVGGSGAKLLPEEARHLARLLLKSASEIETTRPATEGDQK